MNPGVYVNNEINALTGAPMNKTKRYEMQAEPEFFERVDRWRGAQMPIPPRAEAIRIMCERFLDAEEREQNAGKGRVRDVKGRQNATN